MYRSQVHGRKGVAMMAISAVDCAMWDLKGRMLGQPVIRLLGGPTRDAVPAYASTLGYSVEPEQAAAAARGLVAEGYSAMKWFYRHGPTDGREGMAENERLVAPIRDAVGPDVDIMTDAWMSWDVPYTLAMARRRAVPAALDRGAGAAGQDRGLRRDPSPESRADLRR